jgi:hypothetical protein
LLTNSNPNQIVAFTYPFGSGNVFYSTIPLDYYTGVNDANITPAEINTLFGNLADILCFTRGALIETPRGPRPVEALKVGDSVCVASGGTKHIKWISSSMLGQAALARQPENRPVRITAGALGNGLPRRDLLVSRQHRMLVDSRVAERMFGTRKALIAANKLTVLPGIYVDDDVREVEYFHILFESHEMVWAEGTLSESLFTGPEALKSVLPAARAELESLFPQLLSLEYSAKSAALIPSNKAQKELIARHLKNAKAIVSPVKEIFFATQTRSHTNPRAC